MSAYRLNLPTRRGYVLNGVLFKSEASQAETVLIAMTGIHGNFYSSLSKPLICEPDLPAKFRDGLAKVSACVSCNACYNSHAHRCVFR